MAAQASNIGDLYLQFWTKFLRRLRTEHPDLRNEQEPWRRNYLLVMPCPFKGGPRYVAAFNSVQGRIRTELYIDYGDAQANGALFTFLHERRDEIECTYGSALEWAELPGKRASRIRDYRLGDVAIVENHDAYIDWFFDSGTRLRNALSGPAEQWNAQSSGP